MKQVCPWLPTALVFAAACGGQTSLDTFEDGVPSYLLEADLGGGRGDAGSGDASSEGGGSGRDGSTRDGSTRDGSPQDDASQDASNEGGSQGTGAVGDPCGGDDDCAGDSATCLQSVTFGLFEIEFVGGYCVVGGCSDDDDCPAGSGCLSAGGMPGCNKLCDSGSDCREAEGYQCDTIPLSGDSRTFCQPEINF